MEISIWIFYVIFESLDILRMDVLLMEKYFIEYSGIQVLLGIRCIFDVSS